jgi:phosphomethylpyrimidine synthase
LEKLRIALEYETDTVMDLSTGGDIKAIRSRILSKCGVPLGTVPIKQAAYEAIDRRGSIVDMTEYDILSAIEALGLTDSNFTPGDLALREVRKPIGYPV